MTTAEIKDYFKSIRREQLEIIHLAQMIHKEEAELLPRAIAYDRPKVQTSPEDHLAASAAKINKLDSQLRTSIDILNKKRARAEAMIIQLTDANEREVMRYYYLDTKNGRQYSWSDVGDAMDMSLRTVFRIHGDALVNLTRSIDWQ